MKMISGNFLLQLESLNRKCSERGVCTVDLYPVRGTLKTESNKYIRVGQRAVKRSKLCVRFKCIANAALAKKVRYDSKHS